MAVCGAGSKVGERLHAVLAPGTMSQWRAPLFGRIPRAVGCLGVASTLALATPRTESAASRKSVQHGALDPGSCEKALKKLKVPHVAAPGAPKIAQPVILTGPIDDVHFDTGRPYDQRTIAAGDAIDCRLAVSLVDLAKTVKKHGVTHVMVKSFHRPNQVIVDPGAPLRHRIGFAIDISGFKLKGGKHLVVQHDFHGKVGQATCGKTAAKPVPDTSDARVLWQTFCDVAATEAFDSGISPNYNASHFDHVHFDLTADHPILFFP